MAPQVAPPGPADTLATRVERIGAERLRLPARCLMLRFFLDVLITVVMGMKCSTAETELQNEAQTNARASVLATIDAFFSLQATVAKTTPPVFQVAFTRRMFESLDAMLKDLDQAVALVGPRSQTMTESVEAQGYQAWHAQLAKARANEEAKLAAIVRRSTMPFTRNAKSAVEALKLLRHEIDSYPAPRNFVKHVALMKAVFFSIVRSSNGRVARIPARYTPSFMLASKNKRHLRSHSTILGRRATLMTNTRSSLVDRQVDSARSLVQRTHVTRQVTQPDAFMDITNGTNNVRRFTCGMVELNEVDFDGIIRRASLQDWSTTGKRADVVLATPVACPSGEMGRFEAELNRMTSIRHPNLLTWLGVLECDHQAFGWSGQLVQVVWEGGFRDNLNRFATTATTTKKMFAVLRDVALALMALHRAGIAHGNVCGENIVVTADERGKLADFELLRCLEPVHPPKPDRLVAGELLLERWKTGDRSRHSLPGDVYSIAMTAVVALTGELPFSLLAEDEIIELLESTNGKVVHPRPAGIDDAVWMHLTPMLSGEATERPDMARVHQVFASLAA